MKKLIVLAAALLISASAFAQFSYGIKGGLNLANISNSDKIADWYEADASMKPSLYLGVFGEYKVNDFLGIAPELVYSRQGYTLKEKGDGDGKINVRFNYLNVPIMAKIYLTDGLSLELGPQFGFLMSAKMWQKVDGKTDTEDVKKDTNSVDVSFGAGLSYSFGKIFVQGRYNLGLTDTAKDNDGDDKYKNNVIQLGVGYRF